MRYKLCLSLLLTLCFGENKTFAQNDSTINRTHYYYEAGTYLSTSAEIPFWLRTNQYGIVPSKAPIITFRGGIYHDYSKLHSKKYDWGYGVDAAVNVGAENKIYFPEAYLKIKLNKFEFYAGRRREIVGLVDTLLTSGSYSWSGNALPMPKIQLSIPEYLPILGNGLLSIKGSYSHGWFDNQGVIKDFYLHQKTFYARLGKPNWKVKMYAGFNHEVQWSGKPSVTLSKDVISGDSYPSSLKDYWYVISGFSLNNLARTQQAGYSNDDAFNRIGNHLGSIDLGVELNFDKFKVMVYRQSLFETGSLFYLSSIQDGLQGLSLNFKKNKTHGFYISQMLVEYLYTKNQGGIFGSNTNISPLRGRVDYLNNSQYLNGWTYLSKGIGNPFLTVNESYVYSTNTADEQIYNNRVSAVYVGLKGNYNKSPFEVRLSYSHNLGTYNIPFDKSQFSSLIKMQWVLPKYRSYYLTTQLSADFGDLYNTNLGCYLGIRRTFF